MVKHSFVIDDGTHRPLVCDLSLPEAETLQGLLVFMHGYKGFKDWGAWNTMAQALAIDGWAVLKFNFSHNGTTPDQPQEFADLEAFAQNTYSQEVKDAFRVIDTFRFELAGKFGLPADFKIGVVGHSRGGGIAVLVGEKHPSVLGVVTLAAVADFGERFPFGEELDKWKTSGVIYVANARTGQQLPHHFSFYQDFLDHQRELDIRAAARRLNKPLLVIHANDDLAVDVSNARRLFHETRNASLVLLHEGGHTFGAVHPWNGDELPEPLAEATQQISSFFSRFN